MNGKRFQSTKIERALRFLHGPDRHAVGVDHGGFEAGMAQEFLNDADVVIGLQEVGGGGRMELSESQTCIQAFIRD